MEDFIAEIYNDAFIIENLKDFIRLIDSGCVIKARDLYNKTAALLEDLLLKIASYDESRASMIQQIVLRIKDNYEDYAQSKGLIAGELIPALYSYIGNLSDINVTEGKYTLESSDTGFLTLRDNNIKLYLHDTYDPMQEALQIADSIYKPSMQSFHVFGCGLGYLPLRLYELSDSAMDIYIYEDDETLLGYAELYGVISLIPKELIHIICSDSHEELVTSFISAVSAMEDAGYYISPFKKGFNGICNNELGRLAINRAFELESARVFEINLWKNRKLPAIHPSSLLKKYKYTEWIIISAGPSLDDNIGFLKESKGKRGLIAVNTVLRRLVNEGISPDILVAADPFNELIKHISGIEPQTRSIILVADWLLNWNYASLYQGEICFVRTDASSKLTNSFIPNEPVWSASGTVASLALETALYLGSRKVYLAGQDLAYPSGQKYARNMPHAEAPDAKWELQVPSVDGSMVDTSEAFDWFRKSLEHQIAMHPSVSFINLSRHGALIKGTVSPDPLSL